MPRDDDDDAVAEPKDDSLTYLVRKLRSLLRSEAKDQSLRDLFEKLDKNGDKKVTAVELRKGLKDLGFRLDDDEVRDIIKYCDVDGDGEISYLEFESFVESPECKDADVQDVLDRLREIAEGQGGSIAKRIEEMFEDLDEDLSGDVDADEFHDGLRGLGLTLTVKEAEDITKRFPSTGKNAVGPKGP
jgi:Ca2+-binding EF-hand superfamily protein